MLRGADVAGVAPFFAKTLSFLACEATAPDMLAAGYLGMRAKVRWRAFASNLQRRESSVSEVEGGAARLQWAYCKLLMRDRINTLTC